MFGSVGFTHQNSRKGSVRKGDSSVREQSVNFFSDGLRLNGMVFFPDSDGPSPSVVFCQGLGSPWDRNAQPHLAKKLAESGISSLLFDHRGLGQSEGKRGHFYPWDQVADIRSAITFLTSNAQEGVVDQVAVAGASFGGANAIVVAGIDKRVKAVSAACAFANGDRWMKDIRRYWEWRAFGERLVADRALQAKIGESEMVSLDEILIRDPEGEGYAREMAARFGPREKVPLELGSRIVEYKPEDYVERIAPRPLLIIHGSHDSLVPVEEAGHLQERAAGPHQMAILDGAGHYNLYTEYLEDYSALLVAFMESQLNPS